MYEISKLNWVKSAQYNELLSWCLNWFDALLYYFRLYPKFALQNLIFILNSRIKLYIISDQEHNNKNPNLARNTILIFVPAYHGIRFIKTWSKTFENISQF